MCWFNQEHERGCDSDLIQAGRSGFRTPVGARGVLFSILVQTVPESHPASCVCVAAIPGE